MIVQLDESVPVRLSKALASVGCRVLKFPNKWKGLKNGELLARLRQNGSSCLVTCDKNLQFQQAIAKSGLAIAVLPRQRFGDLMPLVRAIAAAIRAATPGDVLTIASDGRFSTEP